MYAPYKISQAVETQQYDNAARINERIKSLRTAMGNVSISSAPAVPAVPATTTFPAPTTTTFSAPSVSASDAREQVMEYDVSVRSQISKTVDWMSMSWQQRLHLLQSRTSVSSSVPAKPHISSSPSYPAFVGAKALMEKHAQQVGKFHSWVAARNFKAMHDAHFDWLGLGLG